MPNLNRRALCILGLTAAPAALAQAGVAARVAREIRSVIEAQLDAFRADNAELAFELASPGIQQQFGSAEYFLAMVRGSYPVVYRPASLGFLVPESVEGEIIQRVRMTDQQGAAWLAIYRMQRQADRSWRINGCALTRDNASTT